MKTNWEELKQKYITTDVSCKELANEFGLSEKTVSSRCNREKWIEEKQKFAKKCQKDFEEEVIPKLVDIYTETALMAAEELKDEVAQIIRIRKQIPDEEKYAEKRVGTCTLNIKAALDTLEHHAYPQRDKDNNNTTFIVGEHLKELFN